MCYIENDGAINCIMQIPNTYWKIVFTKFNKERYKILFFQKITNNTFIYSKTYNDDAY